MTNDKNKGLLTAALITGILGATLIGAGIVGIKYNLPNQFHREPTLTPLIQRVQSLEDQVNRALRCRIDPAYIMEHYGPEKRATLDEYVHLLSQLAVRKEWKEYRERQQDYSSRIGALTISSFGILMGSVLSFVGLYGYISARKKEK